MTDVYCVTCKQCTEFSTIDHDVHGDHFSRMKCNVCSSQIYMCSGCSKSFTAKYRDHRPVRKHISDCHPLLSTNNEEYEAMDNVDSMDIDSDLPPLLPRDDLDIDLEKEYPLVCSKTNMGVVYTLDSQKYLTTKINSNELHQYGSTFISSVSG